jgi:hypothetical protein
VCLRGIRGVILAEGSTLHSSGRRSHKGPSSPRFHVRALRRYVSIISCDRWPVRSLIQVSVRPIASEIVTNTARRSCARRR